MSRGFNCARAEILARREGISWLEASRQMAAAGGRKAQAIRRERKVREQRMAACWWRRMDT